MTTTTLPANNVLRSLHNRRKEWGCRFTSSRTHEKVAHAFDGERGEKRDNSHAFF